MKPWMAAIASLLFACGPSDSATEEPGATAPPVAATAVEPAPAEPLPRTVDRGGGLLVETRVDGSGASAESGRRVRFHCVGRVKGVEEPFLSSPELYEPLEIELGARDPGVIRGLALGLEGLREGSQATIEVPPALAYGEAGVPSAGIPPDATLVFTVEVVSVR